LLRQPNDPRARHARFAQGPGRPPGLRHGHPSIRQDRRGAHRWRPDHCLRATERCGEELRGPGQGGDRCSQVAHAHASRSAKPPGKETIPAIVERFEDATAPEIALIENLQREDLSPLDEAVIYKKMTGELGYSIRNLATKLGKDKGYVENRLRLASAPDDVRDMVGQRYDTLSAAYELMKLDNKRRRQAL